MVDLLKTNFWRYYLTNAEIEVLEANAEQIARRVQPGSVLVELGSGYAELVQFDRLATCTPEDTNDVLQKPSKG